MAQYLRRYALRAIGPAEEWRRQLGVCYSASGPQCAWCSHAWLLRDTSSHERAAWTACSLFQGSAYTTAVPADQEGHTTPVERTSKGESVCCPGCGHEGPLDAPRGLNNRKWFGVAAATETVGVLTLVSGHPIGLLFIMGSALALFGLETPSGNCRHCRMSLTQGWLGDWRSDRAT